MMCNDLPTCPFCGGPAESIVMIRAKRPSVQAFDWEPLSSYDQKFMFRCAGGKCPVMPETVLCDTPEEAAELWSRRVQPPTVVRKDKPCLALRPAGDEAIEDDERENHGRDK